MGHFLEAEGSARRGDRCMTARPRTPPMEPKFPTRPPIEPRALPRIPVSVMEGLFVRGLKAEGKLAERLLSYGYDIKKPEVSYSVLTYQRCVNAARQEVFTHLSDEEAYRLLGRKMVDGFLETLVGK